MHQLSRLLERLNSPLADYVPQRPVITAQQWAGALPQLAPPVYTSSARTPLLVPPVQLFAVHYALDVVIETTHPRWSMHEFARVDLPDQSTWLSKDSDARGVQTITAATEALAGLVPEVPVPRRVAPVRVVEDITDARLELELRTSTPDDEELLLKFSARRPARVEPWRNSSTFNHSAQAAAVVLDVSRKQLWGVKAEVSYDGKIAPLRKIMGLVPVAALLEQTQGGVARASLEMSPVLGGQARVRRPLPAQRAWPTQSDERWDADPNTLAWSTDTHTHTLNFVERGFASGVVHQSGRDVPALVMTLDAPLPDLSRSFDGVARRRFRLDVNGQEGHGLGVIQARWQDDEVVVELLPQAPRWFADRPLSHRIGFEADGRVWVRP